MRKIFTAIFVLLLAFTLVACKKDTGGNNNNGDNGNNNGETPLTDLEKLELGLGLFESKNYQINIQILRDDSEEATITVKFDNNKSHYFEDAYTEEFYVRDNRNLTTYIKVFDKWEINTERKPYDEQYQVYNKFELDWFTFEANLFVLNEDNLNDFWVLFNYPEDFVLEGANLSLNSSNQLQSLTFIFSIDEVKYEVVQTFINWGTTTVILPEVA